MPAPPYTGTRYGGYEKLLTGSYSLFNTYTKEEFILNVSSEYSFLDSRMRAISGVEVAHLNITTTGESSRLQNDFAKGKIRGVGPSFVSFLQFGLVYYTRDLEPDPSNGIFAEVTDEYSSHYIGSAFDLDKLFGQVKYFKQVLPKVFVKMILAAQLGCGYTFGNAPFFEYQDEWSSEGSIEGLGGANTLRGYKQSRFLDRGLYFGNLELRTRFAQLKVLKQHLAFSAVPFMDAGSVHAQPSGLLHNQLMYSDGLASASPGT